MYTKPDKGWLCARTAFVCWIFLMWACVTYFFMCVLVWVCIAACDLLSTSYPLASSWPGAFPANQVWVCCQQVSSAHCEIHQSGAPHSTTAAFISLSLSSFLFFPAQHRTNTNTHPQTHKHTRITSASLYLLQRQRMLMLKKRNTDYCQLGLMMICEKVTKCDCVTSWLWLYLNIK